MGGSLEENINFQEWKQCQISIAEFDKMILDVRKYGFSFITILLTANGILLGFTKQDLQPPNLAFIGIFLVLLILIGGLFRVDRVHEIFLRAAVLRAMKLEEQLNLGLTRSVTYWSENLKTATWGVWLYILLAMAGYCLALVGIFGGENSNQGDFVSNTFAAVVASVLAVFVIILIYVHHSKTALTCVTGKDPFKPYADSSEACWASSYQSVSDQGAVSHDERGK